jgi:hypothetical protein
MNFPFLCFVGKMKDLGALVNAASKKISAKKRHKNVQSLEHLIAGSGPGSTSSPVVDLEGEDPSEELVQESVKWQKVGTPSEQPITPIRAVPVRSERGDFHGKKFQNKKKVRFFEKIQIFYSNFFYKILGKKSFFHDDGKPSIFASRFLKL